MAAEVAEGGSLTPSGGSLLDQVRARGPSLRLARARSKSVGQSQSCMLPTIAQGSPMGLGVGSGYGSWAAGAPVPMWEGGPKWWTVSPMSGAAAHIRDIYIYRPSLSDTCFVRWLAWSLEHARVCWTRNGYMRCVT